jgi:hypothetical protein
MISSICLLAAIQGTASSWTAPTVDQLLMTAGITRETSTTVRTTRIVIPGFAEASWNCVDPSISFHTLPSATPYIFCDAGASAAPPPIAWSAQVRSPAYLGASPVIYLKSDPGSTMARGTLRLQPAPTKSQAGGARALTKLVAGCAIVAQTPFPIALGDEPIEIEFGWDLCSPIPVSADHPYLETDFDALIPFSVKMPGGDPLISVPEQIDARPASLSELRVVCQHSQVQNVDLQLPACMRFAGRTSEGDAEVFSLCETATAQSFHVCSDLQVSVRIASMERPIVRRVRLAHRDFPRDAEGRRLMTAAVIEGETIELWTRGEEQRLVIADRVPACLITLKALGFEAIDSVQVPDEAHDEVELLLGEGRAGIRLRAILTPAVASSYEGWTLSGGD